MCVMVHHPNFGSFVADLRATLDAAVPTFFFVVLTFMSHIHDVSVPRLCRIVDTLMTIAILYFRCVLSVNLLCGINPQVVVPSMERRILSLNATVSSARKGVKNFVK